MTLNGLLSTLLMIAVAYCAVALYIFLMQPRLLYYPDIPTRDIEATPDSIGLTYETLSLLTNDGVALHGWYVPAQAARGTLLFFHGNAGNISHRLDSIRLFHDLDLNVLIFDYRGYGQSDGKTSEQGSYRDADAAWNYLVQEKQTPPHNILLFGRSLGAAIATDLANRTRPAAVVLESAFTSVPDMAKSIYPWLPVHLLAIYRYSNSNKIRAIACPVLVIHSRDDEIIPFSHGMELFRIAQDPKHFLELRGGHNDGYHVSRQEYVQALDTFIDTYLGGGRQAPP